VIASSGRLPAMASNTIPPSASPIPSRRSSSSVDFESSIPAAHVATDAAPNRMSTRNTGRDDTGPMVGAPGCIRPVLMPCCEKLHAMVSEDRRPRSPQRRSSWVQPSRSETVFRHFEGSAHPRRVGQQGAALYASVRKLTPCAIADPPGRRIHNIIPPMPDIMMSAPEAPVAMDELSANRVNSPTTPAPPRIWAAPVRGKREPVVLKSRERQRPLLAPTPPEGRSSASISLSRY
jgi:hypothetical protein